MLFLLPAEVAFLLHTKSIPISLFSVPHFSPIVPTLSFFLHTLDEEEEKEKNKVETEEKGKEEGGGKRSGWNWRCLSLYLVLCVGKGGEG
jgi:hypothetical protein